MRMSKGFAFGLVFAGLTGLGACGSLNEQSLSAGIGQMIKAQLAGRNKVAVAPAPVLTRAAADANPGA